MAISTNLMFSLLYWLTPPAICLLLVPLLCQNVVLSLPRSFLVTHLVMASLARPLLDLAANIWLLQPIVPLLAAAPAIATAFAGLAFFFMLSNVFKGVFDAMNILADELPNLNPFDVNENVKESGRKLFSSFEKFFEHTNFTEMFEGVKPPRQDSWDDFFATSRNQFRGYNFSEALRNLTISESTQQYIDTVNVAVIGLLENLEVSNFFNITRIPTNLYESCDTVSEALRDLAEHLNFTEVLGDGKVPPHLQDSINNVGTALETLGQNLNLTELYETAVSSPAMEEALKQMRSFPSLFREPATIFQSGGRFMESASWGDRIRAFIAWIPLRFHITAGVYIFLVVIGIPLLFFLRAALQDGCLWLVTRRYESNIPSTERSASGWMLVAATAGLTLAATEAFPYCCFYSFLYGSNALPAKSVFVLLIHTLTAAPFRAASQMRIAEAGARRDVLKDSTPRLLSGFVWAALANSVFNVWWMFFSSMLLISLMTVWLPVLFLSTDALVATVGVMWGRRICHRLLRDERRIIEDRERKRD